MAHEMTGRDAIVRPCDVCGKVHDATGRAAIELALLHAEQERLRAQLLEGLVYSWPQALLATDFIALGLPVHRGKDNETFAYVDEIEDHFKGDRAEIVWGTALRILRLEPYDGAFHHDLDRLYAYACVLYQRVKLAVHLVADVRKGVGLYVAKQRHRAAVERMLVLDLVEQHGSRFPVSIRSAQDSVVRSGYATPLGADALHVDVAGPRDSVLFTQTRMATLNPERGAFTTTTGETLLLGYRLDVEGDFQANTEENGPRSKRWRNDQ